MHAALLIADLHLSRERPATLDLFRRFLRDAAAQAKRLYILGDLFDAWIGDDDPQWNDVIEWLATLSRDGTQVFFQHGNRDFLLGKRFLAATGGQLLSEEALVALPSGQTLLMHGDTLCSDDTNYQQAKRLLRDPDFISDFLSKPLNERRVIAEMYRKRSGETTSLLADDIMDVNLDTVDDALRRHGATTLIHGHTHRAARHDFDLDGKPAVRWVLPEWHEERAGYLRSTASGIRSHDLHL